MVQRLRATLMGASMSLLALGFMASPAWSDPRDASGAQGNAVEAIIKRPEGAYIDRFQESYQPKYAIALGALQKVNGAVRAEKALTIDATVSRVVFRIPEFVPLTEAYMSVRDQLVTRAEVVYECQARDCGSSDYWAYRHYQEPKLYGLDDSQFYSVFKDDYGYWRTHIVQRGNKRVYMLLERIVSDEVPKVDTTAAARDVWHLSGERLPTALLTQLTESEQRVWLFVQAKASTLEASMRDSEGYLSQLQEQLTQAGISSERIRAIAAGNLAEASQAAMAVGDLKATVYLRPAP